MKDSSRTGNARTTRHSFAPVIRAGSSELSQGLAETASGQSQTKAAAATGRQCRRAAAAALLETSARPPAALHRERLPAVQAGLVEHRGVDTAPRPAPVQHQRDLMPHPPESRRI